MNSDERSCRLVNLNMKLTGDYQLIDNKTSETIFSVKDSNVSIEITDVEQGVCKHCAGTFVKTHGSQKFCPPLPGSKGSRCKNTFNQRLKRDKEKAVKLFNEGKSIDDIVQIVNKKRKGSDLRTLQQIKNWIK